MKTITPLVFSIAAVVAAWAADPSAKKAKPITPDDPPPVSTEYREAATLNGASAAGAGYFTFGNRVYFVHDGKVAPVDRTLILKITPTGIVGVDGDRVFLPTGQMLAPDGSYVPIPQKVTGLPAGYVLPPPLPAREATPASPFLSGKTATPETKVLPIPAPGPGVPPVGTSPGAGALPDKSAGAGALPGKSKP